MDIAFVGVAARVGVDEDGRILTASVALGAVGPTSIRAVAAAAELVGHYPTAELLSRAGKAAASEAQPIDDLRASARYRRRIVEVLVADVVSKAYERVRNSSE
jgi:carbon-monoxide dehydrogenase medium subunit